VLRWDGGEFRVLSCAPNLLAGVKHSSRSFCDVVTFTSSHSIRCEHSELVASIALLDVHSQLQLNHRLVLVGGRKGRRRHVEEDEKDDDDQDRRRRFEMRVEQQQRFVGFGVERCEMRKKLLLIMSVQSRNDGSFFVVCRVYVEDRE
jgi:hypothetical protein